MNMFIFTPDGHGPLTFMVLADTKLNAIGLVDEQVRRMRKDGFNYDTAGWPENYECACYPSGVVATHYND